MSNLATTNGNGKLAQPASTGAIEAALIEGDLSKLNPQQRVTYYNRVCESLGLNPLTQPFAYIKLNGKLTLYAKRDCCEQLRKLHGISINVVGRDTDADLGIHMVTVRATDREGRTDENIGVVPTTGLKGEALANALMKAHTKAVRRVTLSLSGMGFLDESETESIPDAQVVPMEVSPTEEPLPFKSPTSAIAYAVEQLGISEEDAKSLFESVTPDEDGKKARPFYNAVKAMLKDKPVDGEIEE